MEALREVPGEVRPAWEEVAPRGTPSGGTRLEVRTGPGTEERHNVAEEHLLDHVAVVILPDHR